MNLQAIVPHWAGTQYTGHIPDDVYHHVLANIITTSFKLELVMADFAFYELKPPGFDNVQIEEGEDSGFDPELDASTHDDRTIKLQVWISEFDGVKDWGFGSKEIAERQHVVYALF